MNLYFILHAELAKRGSTGAHGTQSIPEAVLQIAFADRVILNKTDLVSEEELHVTRDAVLAINPEVHVITSQRCRIPVQELLNICAFDASRNAVLLRSRQDEQTGKVVSSGADIDITRGAFHIETDASGKILPRKNTRKVENLSSGRSKRNSGVSTVSLTCNEPLDLNLFNVWMAQLLQEKGNDLYRFKGQNSCF